MGFASHLTALQQPGRGHRAPGLARRATIGLLAAALLFGCRRAPVAPTLARDLEGTVVGEDGQPIAAVALALGADPPDLRVPMATTRTDGAGRFRMRRVPAGSYRLSATRAGFVATALHVDVDVDVDVGSSLARAREDDQDARGQPRPVRLVLATAVVLGGTVEDAIGAPVPLARVLVLSDTGFQGALVPARAADAGGRFRFDGLAAGRYRLLIEAPGLGTAEAAHVVAPDSAVRVVLPGESRFIQGRVTHEGRPALGARVILAGEALSEPRRTESDGRGGFVFGGLGPGTYALRADSGGLVSGVTTDVVLDRLERRTADVALELAPGRFLHGRVVDDAAAPVSAAEVCLDTVPSWGMIERLMADGVGAWSSPALPAGRYRLEARRVGYVSRRAATIELPPHAGGPGAGPGAPHARSAAFAPAHPGGGAWISVVTREVPLELVRTAEVSGRVVDERSLPVSGARVRRQVIELEELGVISAPLPLAAEAAALPSGSGSAPGPGVDPPVVAGTGGLVASRGAARQDPPASTDGVVTGDDGTFRLAGLPPGTLRVEIAQVEAVPMRTAPLELSPGQRRALGDIPLHRAIRLTGQVLSADGAPAPGARVSATPAPPPAPAAGGARAREPAVGATPTAPVIGALGPSPVDFFTVTDDSGRFSLPLRAGTFRVTARVPERSPAVAVVNLDPDRPPPAPITLKFAASPP
jgi:hypothetical protein